MCNAAALTLRVYNTGKAPYWLARKLGPLLQKDYAQVSFWRTREVPYSGTVQTYIRRRRDACGVDGSDSKGWWTMGTRAWAEHEAACSRAACAADLLEADARLDVAISGFHLTGEAGGHASAHGGRTFAHGAHEVAHGAHGVARGAYEPTHGAHEPTPTPYFILSDLLGGLGLDAGAHVLDVGCGAGRVFAYAAATESPCRVTGVEVDAALADRAAAWTRGNDRFRVLNASALDIPLSDYTHFYLFNPFDSDVLVRFLDAIESQVRRRVVLIHMSDNGEWLAYLGRAGWRRAGEGEYHMHPSPGGGEFPVFGCPQHYSIWEYDPSGEAEARASMV